MKQEKCVQCGTLAPQHPIVAIMAFDEDRGMDAIDFGGANGNKFMAMPMCSACHREPKLDAHYTYRAQYKVSLSRAGSSNLG
jgi:hypothetical protein